MRSFMLTVATAAAAFAALTAPALADADKAIRCLVDNAKLIQGTEDDAKKGNAHFAVIEKENGIGVKVKRISFNNDFLAGKSKMGKPAAVEKCMEGSGFKWS
jgi:hypothetical protein